MITIYLSYDYLMITLNPKYSILEYYEVIQKWLHYFFLMFLGEPWAVHFAGGRGRPPTWRCCKCNCNCSRQLNCEMRNERRMQFVCPPATPTAQQPPQPPAGSAVSCASKGAAWAWAWHLVWGTHALRAGKNLKRNRSSKSRKLKNIKDEQNRRRK